ncbi:MAG: patatin-like phospholipase family protein [Deltaproteobacteria bacterium]|nr:patatin-like phospholipase family protein [Deltaproteobacteria bacterium]
MRVGLALGGGAARGLAHLGVVETLCAAGIPVQVVAGTSMGALVGAMFAQKADATSMLADATRFLRSPEFRQARIHRLQRETAGEKSVLDAVSRYISRGRVLASTVTRPSVLDAEDLYELLGFFVDDRDIRSLHVPFFAVAADLRTGEEVILDRGPVIDAVAASSAVPGAFPPIVVGGRECVDGGVVNMVPVSVLRDMDLDYVIASNVSHELPVPADAMKALATHFRTHEITKRTLTRLQVRFADAVITPQIGQIHWADFTKSDEVIEAGRLAARGAIDTIHRDLKRLGRRPRFWRKPRRIPPEHGIVPPMSPLPSPAIEAAPADATEPSTEELDL